MIISDYYRKRSWESAYKSPAESKRRSFWVKIQLRDDMEFGVLAKTGPEMMNDAKPGSGSPSNLFWVKYLGVTTQW